MQQKHEWNFGLNSILSSNDDKIMQSIDSIQTELALELF